VRWLTHARTVDGEAAIDLAYNFLQRWNSHRAELVYYEQFLPVMEAISPRFPVLKPLPNPFFNTAAVSNGLGPSSTSSVRLTREQTRRLGGMAWAAGNGRWRRARELINEQRFGCLGPDGGYEDPRDENAPNNEDEKHGGLLAKLKRLIKRPFSHHDSVDSRGRATKRQHRKETRASTLEDGAIHARAGDDRQQHTTGDVMTGDDAAGDKSPLHSAEIITTVDEMTGDLVTALSVPSLQDRKGKGKGKLTDVLDDAAAATATTIALAADADPVLPELLLTPDQIQQRERERIAQLVIEHSGWDVNRILTEECRTSSPEPYTQVTRCDTALCCDARVCRACDDTHVCVCALSLSLSLFR
jgi:hypothetical protein